MGRTRVWTDTSVDRVPSTVPSRLVLLLSYLYTNYPNFSDVKSLFLRCYDRLNRWQLVNHSLSDPVEWLPGFINTFLSFPASLRPELYNILT